MKRLALILIAIITIAFLINSCSESPINPTNTETTNLGAGTGNLEPRFYYDWGTEKPIKCLSGERVEIYAGAGNPNAARLVGFIEFSNVTADSMTVKYDFNIGTLFPWVVTVIHFDIGDNLIDIPVNNSGNPVPGQFDYKFEFSEPYVQTSYTFRVGLPADPGNDGYYVAAHAGVCLIGGVPGFNLYLPDNVSLQVQGNPATGGLAYWKFQILNGGFISTYDSDGPGPLLPGQYLGWCIDVDHTLGNGTYPAQLFSSYENLPGWLIGEGKIEYPENLDKVNYLVNNFNVGQSVQPVSSCGVPIRLPELLTFGDIQKAIWTLIENTSSTAGLGAWSQERVNAILCNVNANGEGFIPSCNQRIVFIVVPNTGNKITYQLIVGQPIIGQIQIPCTTQCETAWADGKFGAMFPRAKQWGTYFKWNEDNTFCP